MTMGQVSVSLYANLRSCCCELEVEEDRHAGRAVFVFPAGYPGFAGHFPEYPILPAVVQLGVVRYLVGVVLGFEVLPLEYTRIKFRGGVEPEEKVMVWVQLREGTEDWLVDFGIEKADGASVAGGMARFVAAGD